MGVKDIILQESQSVASTPIEIPFEFSDRSSIPDGKHVDDYIITPITVLTWFRLKHYLIHIEQSDLDKIITKQGVEMDPDIREIMLKYDKLLFEIVCIGIHNKRGEMAEWFKEVLKDNCTWEDISILLNAIIYHIGTSAFLNTITALKAVSPLSEEEIIALQGNKDKWSQKAALRS